MILKAEQFAGGHCVVPLRYRPAQSRHVLMPGKGLLLVGAAGTGKTWEAFGILAACRKQDPRRTRAYSSWPELLLQLRQGYSAPQQAQMAKEIIDALREADIAFLDDLGAERFTESNLAWLQETLYVILDYRYNWVKSTILTANLDVSQLAVYLGPRLASRILGMCEVVEFSGKDRRLE